MKTISFNRFISVSLCVILVGCSLPGPRTQTWLEWRAKYSTYKQMPTHEKMRITDAGRAQIAKEWATYSHEAKLDRGAVVKIAENWSTEQCFQSQLDSILDLVMNSEPEVRLFFFRTISNFARGSDDRTTIEGAVLGYPNAAVGQYAKAVQESKRQNIACQAASVDQRNK
jgi:hypothetical protein